MSRERPARGLNQIETWHGIKSIRELHHTFISASLSCSCARARVCLQSGSNCAAATVPGAGLPWCTPGCIAQPGRAPASRHRLVPRPRARVLRSRRGCTSLPVLPLSQNTRTLSKLFQAATSRDELDSNIEPLLQRQHLLKVHPSSEWVFACPFARSSCQDCK